MKIPALFLAFALILPITVYAADQHPVNSCVTINNTGEFPDYDFLYTGMYHFFFAQKITPDATQFCSQNTGGSIVAIKKSDWSKVKYPDVPGGYVTAPENADLFIISPANIVFADVANADNPLTTQNIIAHVNSLANKNLDLSVVYSDTEDADGHHLSESGSKIPTIVLGPTGGSVTTTTTYFDNRRLSIIAAAIVILGLVGSVLARRAAKK